MSYVFDDTRQGEMACHQCGKSTQWQFINVASHQCGKSSMQQVIETASHQSSKLLNALITTQLIKNI
jgi:hypothetical protein